MEETNNTAVETKTDASATTDNTAVETKTDVSVATDNTAVKENDNKTDTVETKPDNSKPKGNTQTTKNTVKQDNSVGEVTYKPFSIPEGFDVPADSFKTVASKHGLSQEQAQAMIDYYCKEVVPANKEAVTKQIDSWKQETINQMGKQGLDMMDSVVKRLSKNNPLFAPLLRDTGLRYHPVVVRAFVDLASHMSEGTKGMPLSTFQSVQRTKNLASIMFPNSLK